MKPFDLHVHTTFSDGANTPEEMIIAAINKGMVRIGFSDHAHTPFDESYCMSKESTEQYRREISELKQKYQGQIEVLCGIEQDYYSDLSTSGFDYVIGSVHYLKMEDSFVPVDDEAKYLQDAAKRYFGGDIYGVVKEYYKTVADVVEKTQADIIGHFDLITKFNEDGSLFDETDARYVKFYTDAVDRLIKCGKPFEINTGAISRGYKTAPYPSKPIRDYIKSCGGSFILSSDSHSKDTLCFGFEIT